MHLQGKNAPGNLLDTMLHLVWLFSHNWELQNTFLTEGDSFVTLINTNINNKALLVNTGYSKTTQGGSDT